MSHAPPGAPFDLACHAGARVEAGGVIARGPAAHCPGPAPGATEVALDQGGREVRATRDGRVVAGPDGLGVADRTVVDGNLVAGPGRGALEVAGTLVVEGGIGAGVSVWATGDVLVAGPVERAEIVAGGAVLCEGRVSGADIRTGVLSPLDRLLRGPLRPVPAALERAARAAANLAAAASARGLALAPADAMALGVGATVPGLPGDLRELRRVLAALHEDLPRAAPRLADEVEAFLDGLARRRHEDLPGIALDLARRLQARRVVRGRRRDGVRARELVDCRVHTTGPVRVTGRGLRDTTVHTPADVSVPAGVVAGGEVVLGGLLRAHGIGGPGRHTEVRLLVARPELPGLERDRIVADRVEGGVGVRAPLGALALHEGEAWVAVYAAGGGIPLQRP